MGIIKFNDPTVVCIALQLSRCCTPPGISLFSVAVDGACIMQNTANPVDNLNIMNYASLRQLVLLFQSGGVILYISKF